MVKIKSIKRLKSLNEWLHKRYEFDDLLAPNAFIVLGDFKPCWYRRIIEANEQYYLINCDALGIYNTEDLCPANSFQNADLSDFKNDLLDIQYFV